MRPAPENVLVICDGGLPALVCCLLAVAPEAVVAWLPPLGSPGIDHPSAEIGPDHRLAVEAQADLLGLRGVEAASLSGWEEGGLPTTAMLLLASQAAARLGCSEVIWPIVCGGDLDELASACDRARILTQLATLPPQQGRARGQAGPEVRVRVPLADLTPQQVAELALDLDGPVHSCWWRRGASASGTERQPIWVGEARLLWEGALRDAARARGYADPVAELPPVGTLVGPTSDLIRPSPLRPL